MHFSTMAKVVLQMKLKRKYSKLIKSVLFVCQLNFNLTIDDFLFDVEKLDSSNKVDVTQMKEIFFDRMVNIKEI